MGKKKNLIVIMTDEHRYDSLACMGHPIVKTPHIDSLAKGNFIFENAYCVSPLCVPSRVSFFTGQYVHRTRSVSNAMKCHIGLAQASFIRILKENGYKVGLAGKNHAFTDEYLGKWFDYREEYGHHGKTHGTITETDKKIAEWRRTEKRFKDISAQKSYGIMEGLVQEPEPFAEEYCISHRIAEDGIRFVEENRDNPFFLYFSFPDPHWPNVVCEPYYSMYNPEDIKLEALDIDWDEHPFKHYVQSQAYDYPAYSEADIKRILATYYGQISFIDKAVGMLLSRIKELGLEEDTLVVFTADHGNFGGRYGLVGKTGGFYEVLVKIPLIMKIPGMQGNTVVKAQISNIDIMPTIFECLDLPLVEGVQGKSFFDIIMRQKASHRDEVYAELGTPEFPPPVMSKEEFRVYQKERLKKDGIFWFIDYTTRGRAAMLKKGNWKYCYYVGDREELYNLKDDPWEMINLANNKLYRNQKEELKNHLLDWILTEPMK